MLRKVRRALAIMALTLMTTPTFVLADDAIVLPERGLCAHRGDQDAGPENTVPAFIAAAVHGAQQVELDVQMTKDGQLVIMHDLTIDRTTNGKGAVKDLTLEEIRNAGVKNLAGSYYDAPCAPTFEEVLDALPRNIWINVHVKPGEGIAVAALKVLQEKDRLHQAFFACGKKDMEALREICPEVKICCMERKPNPEQYIKNAIEWKCDFIQLTHNYTAEEIKRLKDAGIKINFFGTDDPDKIRQLLSDGIDFPLVNKFSADWYVPAEMDGFKLNEVSEEYRQYARDSLPAPRLATRGLCAHRGDQKLGPENTLPAFIAAARAGAQQIEFDVQKTKDGRLVIMHDPTVDRTTNGKGAVKDLTFNEIRELDAGSKFSAEFTGTKVPTFEETLDVLPDNILLNIHIKPGEGVAEAATKVVVEKGRVAQSIIAVENNADLNAARAVCPEIKIAFLSGARGEARKQMIQNAIDMKCNFVQFTSYDEEDVAKLKAAGITINFFGTDDPEKIRTLLRDGIDFPLVNYFTEDWSVAKEFPGFVLNKLTPEYLERVSAKE
ncbi:MAG: glycerophosphodiester phosphodiesterase family protein [Planctomycetia bacterium]|nr:glycerophosphodiester phosphodiesterase family protein [Planctomycetia bacterium]